MQRNHLTVNQEIEKLPLSDKKCLKTIKIKTKQQRSANMTGGKMINTEQFSTKIKNDMKMSLITSIQHCTKITLSAKR